MADHDSLVSELVGMTGATAEQATQYLSASNWDLAAATQAYFADEEEEETGGAGASSSQAGGSAAPANYTGPRTLDGRPAPQSGASSSSSSKKPVKRTGLATLSSLGGGAHDHDDEDDEDDDDPRGPRDTYAGGEKSGLAVQDPNQRGPSDPRNIINDLMARARSQAPRPEAAAPVESTASFRGSGQTLGGEGVASRVIPDPTSASGVPGGPRGGRNANSQPQERVLHLWQDGFSIDDGELRRFDDPANANDLAMIREGRAPVHLMNVRYDEPLDVKLEQHKENYHPLPKKYKPFGGEGRRLGSPVPGESSASAASAPVAVASTASSSAAGSSAAPSSSVDESQPTVMIRIQMPDGTRLPARFNLSQQVSDIYDFIQRASPDLRNTNWVLATTFPNKDHSDKSLVLGDMAEFKKGGTAVVKRV